MIIVTGGAGFIGSNLIQNLNQQGRNDILVVDDLSKFNSDNITHCKILDYLDKEVFLKKILAREKFSSPIEIVFHQGACADTTERDEQFMMRNNFVYSKILLDYCLDNSIPMIYASSAAIYGDGKMGFSEIPQCEKPLNIYGYSKYQFDQYVRQFLRNTSSQIVGLRYFNVYGPFEQHKNAMASVAYHAHQQLIATGEIKLFEGSDGYAAGEQCRDFIYVDDVIKVNLWFMNNPRLSGIFNVGTGRSQTFNEVARAVIAWHGRGEICYIPFPENLKNYYQSFTSADITQLRNAGYTESFKSVKEGVKIYLDRLNGEERTVGKAS